MSQRCQRRSRLCALLPHTRDGRRDQSPAVTFLIPVSAVLLGTVFLKEMLLPRHLAGIALIASVWLQSTDDLGRQSSVIGTVATRVT